MLDDEHRGRVGHGREDVLEERPRVDRGAEVAHVVREDVVEAVEKLGAAAALHQPAFLGLPHLVTDFSIE